MLRQQPDARQPMQRELFARAQREKMPVERASLTHKFSVGGHEGYITVGMYDDKRPGEVFVKMSKEGSTLSGVMDGLALTLSMGLQYGVPLKVLVDKLVNTRFEPSGITANSNIRFVSSVLDYLARWLGGKFISADYLKQNGTPGDIAAAILPAQPLPPLPNLQTMFPAIVPTPWPSRHDESSISNRRATRTKARPRAASAAC